MSDPVAWSRAAEEAVARAAEARERITAGLKQPLFNFRLWWATDYDQLLNGSSEDETGVGELIDRALISGRVLLHAAGGSGKTSILRQLVSIAAVDSQYSILIDLKNWDPDLTAEWDALEDNDPARLALLLSRVSDPRVTEEEIRCLPEQTRCLLLVDGLNEVIPNLGDAVLRVVDSFARRNPRAGAVVADRIVRRPIDETRWSIATIAPIDGDLGLTGIAFFRDLRERHQLDSSSSAGAQHQYLTRHIRLSEADIHTAAEAAYLLYEKYEARTFPLDDLRRLTSDVLVTQLLEQGVLVATGDRAGFSHHLFHDYLASVAVANNRARWHRQGFSVITVRASSFDALAMTLEQIPSAPDSDYLLRQVYDWNPYASAYALASCHATNSAKVSRGMELALLALLAERKWDLFQATAQLTTDALALYPTEDAKRMLGAESRPELCSIIESEVAEIPELQDWFELFRLSPESPLTDAVLSQIADADSLVGWTMANVAKRSRLTDRQSGYLRDLAKRSQDPTIRWRAVHALGSHPGEANFTALVFRLDDPDDLVSYGALRSLVEMAALSVERREGVVRELQKWLGDPDQRTLNRLARVLVLRRPPLGWAGAVAPIVEAMWSRAPSIELQDRWREVADQVKQAEDRAQGGRVAGG